MGGKTPLPFLLPYYFTGNGSGTGIIGNGSGPGYTELWKWTNMSGNITEMGWELETYTGMTGYNLKKLDLRG